MALKSLYERQINEILISKLSISYYVFSHTLTGLKVLLMYFQNEYTKLKMYFIYENKSIMIGWQTEGGNHFGGRNGDFSFPF